MKTTKHGGSTNPYIGKSREEKHKKKKEKKFFFFACLSLLLGVFIWGVANSDQTTELAIDDPSIGESQNPSISASMAEVTDEGNAVISNGYKNENLTRTKQESSSAEKITSANKSESLREQARLRNKAKLENKHNNSNNLASDSNHSASTNNVSGVHNNESINANSTNRNSNSSDVAHSGSKINNQNSSLESVNFTIDKEALEYYSKIEVEKQAEAFLKSNGENKNLIVKKDGDNVKLVNPNSISTSIYQLNTSEEEENRLANGEELPSNISGTKIYSSKDGDLNEEEYNIDELFEDILYAADGSIIPHSGIPYGTDMFPLRDTLPWHPYISLAYIKEEKEVFVAEKVRKFRTIGDAKPLQNPGSLGDVNHKIDYGVAIRPK